MTEKITIELLLSNIELNKNDDNIIIIPKEISKKILTKELANKNFKNIKIFYKDDFIFELYNEKKQKLIKNDFIFLRSALEDVDSIFNKYNLINEIENIHNILNIFFLENNIYCSNNKISIDEFLKKNNFNLLSLETKIFLEILKIWTERSAEDKSTYINKYILYLNKKCNKPKNTSLHLISYDNFYNIEKKFYKNFCDKIYTYNSNNNIINDKNTLSFDNFNSHDFDTQEEELNFIANDIENTYKKDNNSVIALINNDRYFSRRLRAILERKNIKFYDSSGWLLSTSSCCAYINSVLNFFIHKNDYENFHEIIISPYYNPDINKNVKFEIIKNTQKSIKYNLNCAIDKNVLSIKHNSINNSHNTNDKKFLAKKISEFHCDIEFFEKFIINKLEEFNSIELIKEDIAGKAFFSELNNIKDLYKSLSKKHTMLEWHDLLKTYLENRTFNEDINSKIYLLNTNNTSLYKFDKIYICSMSSKNFPKRVINNFSYNNIIKTELTLNSIIDNQETIEDFIKLKYNSKKILLSYHKSDLQEIYTKSKFKIYVDDCLNFENKQKENYSLKETKNNLNKSDLKLYLGNNFKSLTYRDIENFNSCYYCFYNGLNSPKFSQSILSKNDYTFGKFVHEILSSLIKNNINLHDYNVIKKNLINITDLKIKVFYDTNYIPYEINLWKKLIPIISDYIHQNWDKKYNFSSEKGINYLYKNNIILKGRYDLKYSTNDCIHLVDYKTGYVSTKADVISGLSLQLPFYSILDENINSFEYLSLNVSKNCIKSTLFTKDDFFESRKIIFSCLDSINSLILYKDPLFVKKSSSGCEICGYEDLNR